MASHLFDRPLFVKRTHVIQEIGCLEDIFDFLAAYFAGDPAADVNQSGSITVQDIFDFLQGYFIGCP